MKSKLFLFSLCFILMVPIGTLTHELGHIAVAKYYGYTVSLHYASMNYKGMERDSFMTWWNANKRHVMSDSNYLKENESYKDLGARYFKHSRHISYGGPLQTLLTGLLGLSILLLRKRHFSHNQFNGIDWMAVFMAMFLSRFVLNSVVHLTYLALGRNSRGDEDKIANYWQIDANVFYVFILIIFTSILTYLIFKLMPKSQRMTFIISGFIGGAIGWFLWMDVVGPIVLPR